MLPKSFRLSRPEFLKVRASGMRRQDRPCALIFKQNSLGHLRAAVEISTRIDKRATRRNRLRRQIFTLIQNTSLMAKPLDLIIVVKPETQNRLPELVKLLESIEPHSPRTRSPNILVS